eukprot:Sspe_Gene.118179::Locus_110996_Transcript_1_1_Confidence_1.000_Length_795::g.118179::m.118179/K08292/EEF2K; elongation factor 2 kinase
MEPAVRHRYDCDTGGWHTTNTEVEIEPRAFARGGMREAFKALERDRDTVLPSVVKFTTIHDRQREKDSCFRDARMQMVAEYYASMYNKLGTKVPEKVSFVVSDVLELPRRRRWANIEPMLGGRYVKHSNNAGAVISTDQTAQAFSHFTFEASHHQLLVCDIQGVKGMYTDPQIHSMPGAVDTPFGDGDLGKGGISSFFRTHRCNDICKKVGIPPPPEELRRGGGGGNVMNMMMPMGGMG